MTALISVWALLPLISIKYKVESVPGMMQGTQGIIKFNWITYI